MSTTQDNEIFNYLISHLLVIKENINVTYRDYRKEELKKIAENEYNEADIVCKISAPFGNLAHVNIGDRNLGNKGKDILISNKSFEIEVKFLRNFRTGRKTTSSNKTIWKEIEKDFEWLMEDIKKGRKGKSAFILGWFNAYDRFSQIVQLGEGKGSYPALNQDRILLFPFLSQDDVLHPTTSNIHYIYEDEYEISKINIKGENRKKMSCVFLGKPEDKFHFALYY